MNGNGIYGEDADSICMNPSFAITRVPVESLEDAENFIHKVIEYEHFPRWTQDILIAGYKMSSDDSTLYKAVSIAGSIAPHIDTIDENSHLTLNECKKFLFNNRNSFNFQKDETGAIVTPQNFSTVFTQGFSVIEMISHGEQSGWQLEHYIPKTNFYDSQKAFNEVSPTHSLIVSMVSCFTSAFDRPWFSADKCLGEGFISGKNNRVVAYLGSSRSGYFDAGENMIYSIEYEREFYDNLYGHGIQKNLGILTSRTKYFLQDIYYAPFNTYRWLQYSINPFGDPEMPIFTDEPLNFSNVTVEIDTTTVKINANEPGSRICVSGVGENTSYLRRTGTNTLTAKSLPNMFSICITKQDFKPWHRVYQRLADGSIASLDVETLDQYFSENMGLQKESKGTIKKVYAGLNGFNVTTSTNPVNSAKIEIIPMEFSGRIPPSAVVVEIERGLNITTEIPYTLTMQNGIYQIRLKVDGKLQDHVSVLKQ